MTEMTIAKLQHILDVDRRLSDITIVELVGRGLTAEVYKVTLRDDEEKKYALKVMDLKKNFKHQYNVDSHTRPKQFEHFCDKAEKEYTNYQRVYDSEASVKHIVKIIRNVIVSNEEYEFIFLLMPFYFGVLSDFKEYREFDEDVVIDVGLQMLDGLRHLHDKNICHRDIKPDNVFVQLEDNQLMIRLGDLGFSREIDKTSGKGMTSIIVANDYYSAPENAISWAFTKQGDIYSVGMILYWLCNNYDLSHTTKESKPRSIRGSDGLWQIIAKATSFKPNDRYEGASQMYLALSDLQNSRILDSIESKYQSLTAKYQSSQEEIKQLQQTQQCNQQEIFDEFQKNSVLSKRIRTLETEKARLNQLLNEKNVATQIVRRRQSTRKYRCYQDKRQLKILRFMVICLMFFCGVCMSLGELSMKKPYWAGQVYDKLNKKEIANGYYEAAINMGDLRATSCLGKNLLETDVERGLAVLSEAAESEDDVNAIYYLGTYYESQADYDKAFNYYEMGMNNGSTKCADAFGNLAYQQQDKDRLFNTAWNYDVGECFSHDAKKAVYYYQKRIELGPSATTLNNLGTHYVNGTGVKQNLAQAVSYFEEAREAGLVAASYNLGICYENGDKKNLPMDKEKAYTYYLEAANKDYKDAIKKVIEMLTKGVGVEKNLDEANKWQEKYDQLTE